MLKQYTTSLPDGTTVHWRPLNWGEYRKLTDTLKAVREQHLNKQQLEEYYDLLTGYLVDIKLEMADLEKDSALFIANKRDDGLSMEACKSEWKATEKGQRLIDLKHYASATNAQLKSLKNRIFGLL